MLKGIICILLLTAALQTDRTVNYPVRLTYIDEVINWWPPQSIASGMAVPGFAQNNPYNFVVLAFWTTAGAVDVA
jgi:hypothetical protein